MCRRLAALVPAGFLLAALLSRVWLAHAPARIATDLAQPLAVDTYWGAFGGTMIAALLLGIAVATVGYLCALRAGISLRASCVLAALACAAALAVPVIFSSDVYAYAGYGDLALHAISPYAHAHVVLHDPLMRSVLWQWGNPPPICVYGPAFVRLAETIVAVLAPWGASAPLWGFRVLSCLALIACAPLAFAAFARRPRATRLAAAAGIALNPIAIWSCAEGHNDAIVLAVVLAGFALMQRARPLGAALIAAAALIKAPALAASAGLLAYSWSDRARFVRVAAASALTLLGVAALALPLERSTSAHLLRGAVYLPQFSLQYVLRAVLAPWLTIVVTLLPVTLLLFLGLRALLARRTDGAVLIAFAVWIALPNPYPWYALWILPTAFLVWNTTAAWAIVSATLLIALRYIPDATWSTFPFALGGLLTLCEIALPLVLLIAYMRDRERPNRRETHIADLDFAPLHSP